MCVILHAKIVYTFCYLHSTVEIFNHSHLLSCTFSSGNHSNDFTSCSTSAFQNLSPMTLILTQK